MMSTRSFVIAETITSDSFCFILNLLEHIGFHTNDIRTYDINIIVHKTSKDKMLRTISDSHMNIYHGFMECLKLHSKKYVIYVIVLVESKTRTHHGRVGSGRRTAEQRGSAGLDRTGRR